jgi:hypothetical protein
MNGRRISLVVSTLIILVARAGAAQGTLSATRKTIGDTTVIHVVSGSVWGNSASVVEELRIGKLDGAPEEMFGAIRDVALDGRGGVYVFDSKVPALRHFDSKGRYLATLGRKGAGPGEYQDQSLGIKVRPDGRVYLRDPRNARINVYGPDDKPLTQIPVSSGLFASNATVIDAAGEIYLKTLLGPIEKNKPWPLGIMHLAPDGKIIDSIAPPRVPGEPESELGIYLARKMWEQSPLGYIVAGVNTAYRFQFTRRDGKVLRIEMNYTPVRFAAEERAEIEAEADWMRKNRARQLSSDIPPTPPVKPAFSGFNIGDDGQIWVKLHVPAVKTPLDEDEKPKDPNARPVETWSEPATFDVFQPDGTYLGRVRMPDRVNLLAHRGDELWGSTAGEFGELYLVRYRLRHR